MPNKRQRQALISELVESNDVESQEELRQLLLARGWDVTQSTLSRDLRELRLARIPTADGGVRYALPEGGGVVGQPRLEALLPHLFTHVDGVGELVVVHTHRGGAQPVAEAFDNEEWPEVLGTLAGDDTILLVCRSAQAREKVVRRVKGMVEGEG